MPQGVSRNGEGYMARLRIGSGRVYLGTYKTPEEAHRVYKKEKCKVVKSIAEKHKDVLDYDVYKNLISFSL